MTSTAPDSVEASHAAYRLGRDRFTLRMWQELAWRWDIEDESIAEAFQVALDELVGWSDQLSGVIDPLAAIDVKRWVEHFRKEWDRYFGSELHRQDRSQEHSVPFHAEMQDLQRMTDLPGLFLSGRSDVAKWFRVGSIIGRCEHLNWAGSSLADGILQVLADCEDVSQDIRHQAREIRGIKPTLRFEPVRQLHHAVVELLHGKAEAFDPSEYTLVLDLRQQDAVYFLGNRITTLDPYQLRLLRAFADHPGKPISWGELAKLSKRGIKVSTVISYVSRLLQTIAKECCGPGEYAEFRKRLKTEFIPTDEESGHWYLNVESEKILILE